MRAAVRAAPVRRFLPNSLGLQALLHFASYSGGWLAGPRSHAALCYAICIVVVLSHACCLAVQGHKIPQGWKSTHKFVGAFMRDLQRAEDAPPLTLGSSKTVKDLKRRAENIIEKASSFPPA